MVGVSEAMAEVARLILKFAPSNDAVLIRSEKGTGKEGTCGDEGGAGQKGSRGKEVRAPKSGRKKAGAQEGGGKEAGAQEARTEKASRQEGGQKEAALIAPPIDSARRIARDGARHEQGRGDSRPCSCSAPTLAFVA